MIPVLISARLENERLPGKLLLDLGDIPAIEHVVLRCKHFGFMPTICCPEDDTDDFLDFCICLPYTCKTAEECVLTAANDLDIKLFHHLDADDPFFDEWAVIDSFNAAAGGISRVNPSYNSQAGSGRVGTSYNLTPQAKGVRNLTDRMDNHPWPQRLTLDYTEDYHLISAVNRMVGGYMAPRRVVDELFIRNPDLHKVNWFRNAEWKERQIDESRSGS
jgi:spore coat polysaccharide biosynthesis protein SpsF (cytidylyltransferase family)